MQRPKSPTRGRTSPICIKPSQAHRIKTGVVHSVRHKPIIQCREPSILLKGLVLSAFGVQILFLLFNIFGRQNAIHKKDFNPRTLSKKADTETLLFPHADVPAWLLFRSVRSAILLTERHFSTDLRVPDLNQNIKEAEMSCVKIGIDLDVMCNISLHIRFVSEEPFSASDSSFETATRALSDDSQACNLIFNEESNQDRISFGGIATRIQCRDLLYSESSRVLVIFGAGDLASISSWISEAESSEIPFHISIIGRADQLLAARNKIILLVKKSRICASIRHDVHNDRLSTICSESRVSIPMLHISLETGHRSKKCQSENQVLDDDVCTMSEMLANAESRMMSSSAFDYIILQKSGHVICEATMTRLVQHVLSLRRAFSMVLCGWKASCLLLNRHDIGYWASILDDATPSDSLEEVLLHRSHGLNTGAQRYFGDRGVLVTHTPMLQRQPAESLHSLAGEIGPRCGEPLDKVSNPDLLHEEELYQPATGCVPEIDFLSPCADSTKTIALLQQPQWFRRVPVPHLALSVQVLANNRPGVLFRTLLQLVEQTLPQCVTVHLDGDNVRSLTDAQWASMRVAQWFERAFGVRWRRNGDSLHPSLARRLGFRRNYADAQHASGNASAVDRLVHMTWNALAHAFEGRSTTALCKRNSTVVLEDDLLPASDLMEYMSYGLGVMEREPLVRVVSAWNDNGFNLRPGLQCAVQRGEYFMSLGWLTTRSVYEELTSPATATSFWPVKKFAYNGTSRGILTESMLRIATGWETAFIELFARRKAFGLFPSVSRVTHQRSRTAWSTSAVLQGQILDPQTPRISGTPCNFNGAQELEYDAALELRMLAGQWKLARHGCQALRYMLSHEASQTFVIALVRTANGFTWDFSRFLLPFGLLKGYAKVRGGYKDTVLVHVAHHLLVFLGPHSPLLNNTELLEKYLHFRLPSKDAVRLFSCRSPADQDESECGRLVAAQGPESQNMSFKTSKDIDFHLASGYKYPQQLVQVVVGRAGEDCGMVCSRVDRSCAEWGGIYSQMATHMLLDNSTLYRSRIFEPCKAHGVYGPILRQARSDLPIIDARIRDSDPVRLGSVRLFRCNTSTDSSNRRLCPCFNKTYAAVLGGLGLF